MAQNEYRGKPIGVDQLTCFPMLADTATETTYGEPIAVPGTQQIQLTPEFAESQLYGDNIAEDDISLMTGANLTLDDTQIIEDVRAKLFGHVIDDKGGMIHNMFDSAPYFGVTFRVTLSKKDSTKKDYLYVALLKVKFKEFQETFKTTEGTNVTMQTHAGIGGKAFARQSDGNVILRYRSSNPKFAAEIASKWATTMPTITAPASPSVGQ